MSGGPVPLGGRPTLLHQAAAQGNVTLLSMLLNEEGLNINDSCEDGCSALYSAARNGHTGVAFLRDFVILDYYLNAVFKLVIYIAIPNIMSR